MGALFDPKCPEAKPTQILRADYRTGESRRGRERERGERGGEHTSRKSKLRKCADDPLQSLDEWESVLGNLRPGEKNASKELKGKISKALPSLGIVCVPTNQSEKILQFKRAGAGKLLPMGQLGLNSCTVLIEHSYTHSFTQCLRLLSCYNSRTEYL